MFNSLMFFFFLTIILSFLLFLRESPLLKGHEELEEEILRSTFVFLAEIIFLYKS